MCVCACVCVWGGGGVHVCVRETRAPIITLSFAKSQVHASACLLDVSGTTNQNLCVRWIRPSMMLCGVWYSGRYGGYVCM